MTVLKDNNNIFASNIEKYAGNESTLQYNNVTLNCAKKRRKYGSSCIYEMFFEITND